MNIVYEEGNVELMKKIKKLWIKIRDYHSEISINFSYDFDKMSFRERYKYIKELSIYGKVKVFLAKDEETNKYVGYSVAAIGKNAKYSIIGEIESLFVEKEYRNNKIATNLVEKSLDWFQQNKVSDYRLEVASGNEKVLNFYKKFGFYPRCIILKNKKD